MKTIFHANIDGHEVVLGFGEAFGLVDPVATNIRIAPLLPALDETKQLAALNAQMNAKHQEAAQAFALADGARMRGDAAGMAAHNGQYQSVVIQIADLEKQFPPLVQAFEAARARITEENAVYTHPPQGEDLIDDAQAAEMAKKWGAKRENQALLMTGEYIDDLRGAEFYLPPAGAGAWKHMVIDKLGETLPDGALTPGLLTDDQREEIAAQAETARIAALSPEARAEEVDREKSVALSQAAQKRSELEIAGDPKALATAQADYQTAVAAISEKYGI